MKNAFIMGDSYSTYKDYIPEEYRYFYSDQRDEKPIVNGVEKTWWRILAESEGLNIVLNDSYSGSTVSNTIRPGLPFESSFVNRFNKYVDEKFFEKNKIDTMFIFGGTNDSWIGAPVGDVLLSEQTEEDLKAVIPAFCYIIGKAKTVVENIVVIINTKLKVDITQGIVKACEEYNVKYVILNEIDKESGHPTVLGMKQISDQVAMCMAND